MILVGDGKIEIKTDKQILEEQHDRLIREQARREVAEEIFEELVREGRQDETESIYVPEYVFKQIKAKYLK